MLRKELFHLREVVIRTRTKITGYKESILNQGPCSKGRPPGPSEVKSGQVISRSIIKSLIARR